MSLYTYTIEQSEIWDKVVRSFEFYDVYYLSGYVKAFQLHKDGEPLLFYYEDEDIRGINVVMKRDIADDPFFSERIQRETYFDFITPYGYGGWLTEGCADKNKLFFAYQNWCREHNVVSEFVRCHPVLNNAESLRPFYDVVTLGNTVSMDLSSPKEIWGNLTSKNRNMVRKALKSGVEIYQGRFPEIYKTFKKIYDKTMEDDNAKEYYYFSDDFYDSILYELSEHAQVFWAVFDGKIIAASIMLFANGYMNYHLSGSLREYQYLAPSNLLLYKAALWGCFNGYRSLHLGGGVGSQEDGLYKFKSSFNRNEPLQFSVGKRVFWSEAYEELKMMKNPDDESSYFPKYRGN